MMNAMISTAALDRIRDLLLGVPESVSEGLQRIYVFQKLAYFLALLLHAHWVVLFHLADQPLLAYVNVGSAACYVLALALHTHGIFRIPIYLGTAEVLGHAALCVVQFGTGAGFELYVVVVVVIPWLHDSLRLWERVGLSGTCIATFLALLIFGGLSTPLQPMEESWVIAFQVMNGLGLTVVLVIILIVYNTAIQRAETALASSYEESEALLHNILPAPVAARLKGEPGTIADLHPEVTILFADIVNFTPLSARLPAGEVVTLLNAVFSEFDDLVDRFGLEKIKTVGDAYMVVAGLPTARADHAEVAADLALAMQAAIERHADDRGAPMMLRIGISSGMVVAGVIGKRKFAYDIWGDAVNTAARMESQGVPGRIQVSAATAELLRPTFELESRGAIEVKGKGTVETWFLGKRR